MLIILNGRAKEKNILFRRECNTEHGSIDCWEKTTDGFAYGLATTMVDYCQVILELRQMSHDKVR